MWEMKSHWKLTGASFAVFLPKKKKTHKRRTGNFWYFLKIYHNVIECRFEALYISNWIRPKKGYILVKRYSIAFPKKKKDANFPRFSTFSLIWLPFWKAIFPWIKKRWKKKHDKMQKQLAKLSCKLISNTGNLNLNQGVMMKRWWIAYCFISWVVCLCRYVWFSVVVIFMW